MQTLYPASPAHVPESLIKPTRAYRVRAWLALCGLTLFFGAYFGLTAACGWLGYVLLTDVFASQNPLVALLVGGSLAFLTLFLCKALFFVKRYRCDVAGIEVTRKLEPQLFEFLDKLADEARAPRLSRVFLSASVTARVFCNLSIFNLVFPPRKHLELGIGLINVLTLGETKAVLAHELGHFARRSMAAGRWIYVAQQIAAQVIARRDALDRLLSRVSHADLRIAWIGWLLSMLVWSLRSVLESLYRVVAAAERALAREVEFQADNVAVALTGSDALIHALHRLQGADAAWQHTMAFAASQAHSGYAVTDLCSVQTRVIERLRLILEDPHFGGTPPAASEPAEQHRVFKSALARPPCMWVAHPTNSDREHNAKRVYLAAPIDARSSWELFYDPAAVRAHVVTHLLSNTQLQPLTADATSEQLARAFSRPSNERSYRGAYRSRTLTREVRTTAELYDSAPRLDLLAQELACLYPQSLAQQVQSLRELEAEQALLVELRDGVGAPITGGAVQYRGRTLKRSQLAALSAATARELAAALQVVHAHDRRCRTLHLVAAAQLGTGWDAYLKATLQILHYAEHNEANLLDAQQLLRHAVGISHADGRGSSKQRQHLVLAAVELHNALRHIYEDEGRKIVLDARLAAKFRGNWQHYIGTFTLPLPDEDNLTDWLKVVDGWVRHCASCLIALQEAALDQLLSAEAYVAQCVREQQTSAAAPMATTMPREYPTLVRGQERSKRKELNWWDRFHAGDGTAFMLGRLAIAGTMVAVPLSLGAVGPASRDSAFNQVARGTLPDNTAMIYVLNGLAREVRVAIGTESLTLAASASLRRALPTGAEYQLRATTMEGELIEEFAADTTDPGVYIYNVAAASPLMLATITYDRNGSRDSVITPMGARHWLGAGSTYVLEDPPERVSTKAAWRVTQTAILDRTGENAYAALQGARNAEERARVIATQARWAPTDTAAGGTWLRLAARNGEAAIIGERLDRESLNPLLLRLEQDASSILTLPATCARQRKLLQTTPANVMLQAVTARCLTDDAERRQTLLRLYQREPRNGWVALEVGYMHLGAAEWNEAVTPLRIALDALPAYAEAVAVDLGRVLRQRSNYTAVEALAKHSPILSYNLSVESGKQTDALGLAYHYLSRGYVESGARLVNEETAAGKRFLRLAAASDGASPELLLLGRVLDTAADFEDSAATWAALGLARLQHDDDAAYVKLLRQSGSIESERILQFLAKLQKPQQAEELLRGLSPRARGYAYSTGVIVLQDRAPNTWRDSAMRLLYATERPYFYPVSPARREQRTQEVVPGRTPPKLMRY